MFDLAVCGGSVLSRGGWRRADVGVRAGKVAAVRRLRQRELARCGRVVAATGCLVLPGAVDAHVHFALPLGAGLSSADDFHGGSRSAAAGGITCFVDYTTPQAGQPPLAAFAARRRLADAAACIDYSLHNVLIDWRPEWEEQLDRLARAGAPSVKVFMIYRECGWQTDDGRMLEIMGACRRRRLTLCVHAENDALVGHFTRRERERGGAADALARARPRLAEEEAVARAIRLAGHTGCRLHLVHLSTAAAALLVGEARRRRLPVSGETCPQYLALERSFLSGPEGHLFGCCPPLRERADRDELWRALADGRLQAITTDHCAFTRAQKDAWGGDFTRIPYGLPGVETSLSVTFTLGPARGRLSLSAWARAHTEGPARLFGLYPRKGTLQPGADADILIWDPKIHWSPRPGDMESRLDWNPYQGMRLRGRARLLFLRGREVAREGRYSGGEPGGKFIPRSLTKEL